MRKNNASGKKMLGTGSVLINAVGMNRMGK